MRLQGIIGGSGASNMEKNPLVVVLERIVNVSMMYGTAFVKVTWDSDNNIFNFSVIPPEHVTVKYEKKNEG